MSEEDLGAMAEEKTPAAEAAEAAPIAGEEEEEQRRVWLGFDFSTQQVGENRTRFPNQIKM